MNSHAHSSFQRFRAAAAFGHVAADGYPGEREVGEPDSPEISQDDEEIIDAFIMRHQARNLIKD